MQYINKLYTGSVNNFKAILVVATFLILNSGTLQAGTYYVSPTGTASWSSCTNINSPCQAQAAMQNAVAGDTINFRGGTYSITDGRTAYHGTLEPSNSGTQNNPIIFQAYQDEIPKISINCTSPDNQCIAVGTNSKNYITWDGFVLTTSNNKTAGIFIGGQAQSTGAVFKNSTIIAGNLPVPNRDNFDMSRMEKTSYASYINNRVGGLNSTDRTTNSSNNACLKMYFNDHATIRNNEFFGCPTGISSKANINDSAVRYNYFRDNFKNMEIHVYNVNIRNSNNNTLDNNIFSKPGRYSVNIQANENGLASGWDIHNNTFYATSNGTFDRHLYLGASVNLSFYNNIMFGVDGEQFSTVGDFSTLASMDHNQFGTGSIWIELRRYGNPKVYNSLSSWKTSGELTGGSNPGIGSLASDPLFVNSSGSMSQPSDFALTNGSPSKGTGRNGADMGAKQDLVGHSGIAPPKPPTILLTSN